MSDDLSKITKRKKDHLRIALSGQSQVGSTGFEKYRFVHNALPEINFDDIDASTEFPCLPAGRPTRPAGRLDKKVNYPFFISCMTGGVAVGKKINRNLAKAAQRMGIAMGVGSQRAAIEHPELEELFKAREVAPDIPLLANVGLVQLNYGFGLKEYQRCVDMIKADALVVHINPIQEIIQPEGDRNWENLLPKLEKIVKKLTVPIIAKEVGFGLSYDVVKRLYNIGIRVFDTAGWGGTNWALVEGLRGKADKELGELFSSWGIPTAESIKACSEFKSNFKSKKEREEVVILGSGGIRTGVDIAKAICLGADLVGIAAPFAKAAIQGSEEVEKLILRLGMELKVSMFGVGAENLSELKKAHLIRVGQY